MDFIFPELIFADGDAIKEIFLLIFAESGWYSDKVLG